VGVDEVTTKGPLHGILVGGHFIFYPDSLFLTE
jgi:hypothetical protein